MNNRYNVPVGRDTAFAFSEGLALIKNASNSTDYDIVLLDYSGKITVLSHNISNYTSYGEVSEGKVCILKENGNYVIKNRCNATASVVVRL